MLYHISIDAIFFLYQAEFVNVLYCPNNQFDIC